MAGDINLNISKLPESPIFWVVVIIFTFIGLLASDYVATAFTLLFICVFAICLVAAIKSTHSNATAVYVVVCLVRFSLVFALALLFVADEWNTKEAPASQTANITGIIQDDVII